MEIKYIENGSVTSAKGFTANGICAGVKASNTTKKGPFEDGDVDAVNAAALSGKLLQMANGAVYDENHKVCLLYTSNSNRNR